jgi:hypothetical protein
MTDREQITVCPKCGEPGEFGYKIKGEMQWFCDKHRLSQNYADARTPLPEQKAATPTTTAEHKLAEHAEAIRAAVKCTAKDIIEVGRRLTEARQLCHGEWLAWLEKTCTTLIGNPPPKKANGKDIAAPLGPPLTQPSQPSIRTRRNPRCTRTATCRSSRRKGGDHA